MRADAEALKQLMKMQALKSPTVKQVSIELDGEERLEKQDSASSRSQRKSDSQD